MHHHLNFVHGIIIANVLMVIFNVAAMTFKFPLPPMPAYVSLWVALVLGIGTLIVFA